MKAWEKRLESCLGFSKTKWQIFLFVGSILWIPAICQGQGLSRDDLSLLVHQLNADKAVTRDRARDELCNAKLAAFETVLATLLNDSSPPETQARCVWILKVWEKDAETNMLKQFKRSFAKIDPDDFPHAATDLSEIKKLCMRDLVQRLSDIGIGISNIGNDKKRVFWKVNLWDWEGPITELRHVRGIKGRLTIQGLTPEMLPAFEGMDVFDISFGKGLFGLDGSSFGRPSRGYVLQESDFRQIAEFRNLKSLALFDCEFDELAIKPLSKHSNLTRVGLHETANDATFAIVCQIPNLQELSCQLCSDISANGLRHLEHASQLRRLHWAPNAKDDSLEVLNRANDLQYLNCQACVGLTGTGIEHLKNLRNLTGLRLPSSITTENFLHIGKLSKLQSLHVTGSQVTDEAIAELSAATELRSLNLEMTHVRGMSLPSLKKLVYINLDQNYFMSDLAIEKLTDLPDLNNVDCAGSPITDQCLESLLNANFSLFVSGTLLTKHAVTKFNASFDRKKVEGSIRFVPSSSQQMKALTELVQNGAGINCNISYQKDGISRDMVWVKLIEGVWKGTDNDLENLASIPHMLLESNLKSQDRLTKIMKEHNEKFRVVYFREGSISEKRLKEMEEVFGKKRLRIIPRLGL